MARSNKELTDLALALGAELSVAVQTDGLKNEGLEALVAELEAKKSALPPAAPADPLKPPVDGASGNDTGGTPPPPVPEPPPALPKGTVSVAPGLSIVCLRGHLNEGAVVTAADFGGGAEDLGDLLGRGALVKS